VTTNEPRVSREHILALAKKCGMVWGYTTTELVDAVIGFAYVVLNDKAVQEAFVLANPRPVLDSLTQEISAMKQHLVEARQALDINDFAHCAYEIDAALKVGAGTTAYDEEKHGPRPIFKTANAEVSGRAGAAGEGRA
jgi:hypothetical protein